MIPAEELERLQKIEKRVVEIARKRGLLTTEIIFEVVSSQRILEGMSYHFPENFSYWQHGRDYDHNRMIYEHTGGGIPYEQVWNFDSPKALIVETAPFPLKVLTVAHVVGHVDFFLANRYSQMGRTFGDVASEARQAADRFRKYEERYGIEEVEELQDAADSIRWHQPLDPFEDESLITEDDLREAVLEQKRAELEANQSLESEFSRKTREEIKKKEKELREIALKTPALPRYDILNFIIRHAPDGFQPWEEDILQVMRGQTRHLTPNGRTKMLNEGWASWWHTQIMRQLFSEGLLTSKEHGIYLDYHTAILRPSRKDFNPYFIGFSLFEHLKERWDRGCFGKEYEDCEDPHQKAYWDTGVKLGMEKIFAVRKSFSDRMAVDAFFTDDFIREQKLYIWHEEQDPYTREIVEKIAEDRPEIIREVLKNSFASYGGPIILVRDGNWRGAQELMLEHQYRGHRVRTLPHLELNPVSWRNRTLEAVYFLWGRPVHLESFLCDPPETEGKPMKVRIVRFTYDGQKHSHEVLKETTIAPEIERW